MKNFKKALALVLVVAVAMTAGIMGTLAYLTSEDSDVNVMTMGFVSIKQHEYEREQNADGSYVIGTVDERDSYILQPFSQGKPLLPIVGDPSLPGDNPGYAGYDSIPVRMSQVDSYGGMDVFAGKNAQDKFVVVENNGITDAYVRTIVAIEIGSTDGSLIGSSYHSTWTKNKIGTASIGGTNFVLIEYTYAGAPGYRHEGGILPAGDTAYPSLSQVYIKSAAKNEDCKAIDGNGNGTLDILVLSQAVQAAGFADAATALNTAFGAVNADNAAKWFARDEVSETPEFETNTDSEAVQVAGGDKAAVMTAIENAQPGDVVVLTEDTTIAGYNANLKLVIDKAITLDLNGKTLTTESGWGGIDLKGGASIVNGTINHTGNTAAIKAFQVGKIENVVINVTETPGKVKGGIVVQEGAGCYVGSIKNVVINGATNGIETYRCGDRTDLAIGSLENVTINATDTGIALSAPIGTLTNCTIKGGKIGIKAYLYGPYIVEANLVNCIVEGAEASIYAHDEVGKTNPGSMYITYDAETALTCIVVREFESEVADRVYVGVK